MVWKKGLPPQSLFLRASGKEHWQAVSKMRSESRKIRGGVQICWYLSEIGPGVRTPRISTLSLNVMNYDFHQFFFVRRCYSVQRVRFNHLRYTFDFLPIVTNPRSALEYIASSLTEREFSKVWDILHLLVVNSNWADLASSNIDFDFIFFFLGLSFLRWSWSFLRTNFSWWNLPNNYFYKGRYFEKKFSGISVLRGLHHIGENSFATKASTTIRRFQDEYEPVNEPSTMIEYLQTHEPVSSVTHLY